MPNQAHNWKLYSQRFARIARREGRSEAYIAACLVYAQQIHAHGLPIIYTPSHFCNLVGYAPSYVMGVSNSAANYYRSFSIPKKSGGEREISEPLPSLKEIQRWVLDNILSKFPLSPHAKAFRPGHSIKSNAKFHRQQPIVLGLDVHDFFGSIHGGIVFNLFRKVGYRRSVATLLTNLCILDGSLPQGAPTSPAISNIIMTAFDRRISSFCIPRDIRYTRYADDITFSGDFDTSQVIRFVKECLSRLNLFLNDTKTRILKNGFQQRVTGVIVNEFLQAPRSTRRNLRQSIFYIEKYGLYSHLHHEENTKSKHIEHLLGIANFIIYLNATDRDALHAREVLIPLLRERLDS